MNRLGMMVDISHVSDKTFYAVLATTTVPVIASHSSCRVFSSHPRNMDDDMLRAIAKNEGVVHINYYNPYLDEDHLKRDTALDMSDEARALDAQYGNDIKRRRAEQRKLNKERITRIGRVSFERLLDHFMHVVEVAGVAYVGLGSDFDGVGDQLPEGMEDAGKTANLVRGLLKRGLSEDEILQILGGNTIRVMRAVEKRAAAEE